VPVSLTPRPQPGDLITSDWTGRLADAITELYAQVEALSRRLAVLEQGGGRQVPELVPVDPNRYKEWVDKIRGTDIKILDEPDKAKRLDKVKELWMEERKKIVLDDDLKMTGEITEQEWLLLGTAAGIKPSEVPIALATKYPATSRAVTAEFGNAIVEFDSYANLTEGQLGFLR
jgi:hypothetical protein